MATAPETKKREVADKGIGIIPSKKDEKEIGKGAEVGKIPESSVTERKTLRGGDTEGCVG